MELFDRVVVATDAPELRDLCEGLGAPVVMTDPAHPSGTDRVAEVSEMRPYRGYPIVVNVQGDEPLVVEDHLREAVDLVRDAGWEVGTCATPIRSLDERRSPSVVKVVRGRGGRALYFSRSEIPHVRDASPEGAPPAAGSSAEGEPGSVPLFLRHLGLYSYRREALLRWVSLPVSPLEEAERLEQLRALEEGITIGVAVVEGAGPGVDTPADVVAVERLLRAAPELVPAQSRT
jgi:3-deoxy-manno-octulosonate cytidylyltransferase (CMP-KDO synthetase)